MDPESVRGGLLRRPEANARARRRVELTRGLAMTASGLPRVFADHLFVTLLCFRRAPRIVGRSGGVIGVVVIVVVVDVVAAVVFIAAVDLDRARRRGLRARARATRLDVGRRRAEPKVARNLLSRCEATARRSRVHKRDDRSRVAVAVASCLRPPAPDEFHNVRESMSRTKHTSPTNQPKSAPRTTSPRPPHESSRYLASATTALPSTCRAHAGAGGAGASLRRAARAMRVGASSS